MHGGLGLADVNGHGRGRMLHIIRSKCDFLSPYDHIRQLPKSCNSKLVHVCWPLVSVQEGGWVDTRVGNGGLEIVVENK